MSVIGYLISLIITALVLFHDYGNKDTAVLVSLVIVAYGTIRAHLSFNDVLSAKLSLDLAKLIQRSTMSDEQQDGREDFTVVVKRDLPYTLAGALFYMALAAPAAAKLLVTLLL
ncbi:MAG TPA: hypothetical protein VI386_08640 [Candidatus Sulfotelmatobacter sp.]